VIVFAVCGQRGENRGLYRVLRFPSLTAFADPKRRLKTGRSVSPPLSFEAALALVDILKGRR